jgi:pimeloyl-ACP methyl ester carboxylesterase
VRLDREIDAAIPHLDMSRVLSATSFVVRSQGDVTNDLDRMAAMVRADDHPIRNVWVSPSIVPGTQLVTGEVQVTDFRDPNGVIADGAAITSTHHWIDFMLTIPEYSASPAGAPVVIYGHGLAVQRETMLTVAGENAKKGLATIGIDIPNHGSRSWDEGGYLTELATPYRFGRLASMPLQGIMDNLSLLMAVKTSFPSLDVHPVRNWLTTSWGDGVPDLDTRHVLYEGTSMGGFLGASFAALAPELDGAFVQVGGTGIVDTIFHSLLWPLFAGIAPWGSTAGDAHALLGAAGMLMDRADNVYLLDRIRQHGTPFYLVYAMGDGIVPNSSSERMVRLLGLPLLAPTYWPVPGTTTVGTMPADGTGASQFPTWDAAATTGALLPLTAHTWFSSDRPAGELDHWLDQRLAAMHLSG